MAERWKRGWVCGCALGASLVVGCSEEESTVDGGLGDATTHLDAGSHSDGAPDEGDPDAGQLGDRDGGRAGDAASPDAALRDAATLEGGAVDASTAPEDAGAEGAAPDAGAIPGSCAGKDYLLCEDFESTAVASIPEGFWLSGSDCSVADDAAHWGERSLKSGPLANGARRIHTSASQFGSAHWGRVFYRVQTPVPDAFVHSTLVALEGDGPNIGTAEYRVVDTVKQDANTEHVGSRHNFLFNVQPYNSGEFGRETAYDYTFDDAWHCAEWHIDADVQGYAFYLDGQLRLSFEDGPGQYAGSEIPAGFSELRVGWNNYQAAPPGFTAWFDDLAVDDARIGCDR